MQKRLFFLFLLLFFFTTLPHAEYGNNGKSTPVAQLGKPGNHDHNPYRNAYFGNLHQHTGYSFDAFVGAVWHRPENAYRYAKGEEIDFEGGKLQLQRPLDFLAITDHAEYLGAFPYYDVAVPNKIARKYKEKESGMKSISGWQFAQAFLSMYFNRPVEAFNHLPASENAWQELIGLADKHYQPGAFTTFAGFEWTGHAMGFMYAKNRHRCVIFRSTVDLPNQPFSQFDSRDPEDLWAYLEHYRKRSGEDVIAIPHNMNISDGLSYSLKSRKRKEFDSDYIQTRKYNEPVNEVVQKKGQSMTHPYLSPNDEFSDYHIYDKLFSINLGVRAREKNLETSYVRSGLKLGLEAREELGENPFKFGLIGSSDDHNGISLKEKVENDRLSIQAWGLAGVWAEENTRESIFAALRRKETFATSDSRMKIRFFGGWDYGLKMDVTGENWLKIAYEKGVPMGGDLPLRTGNGAPRFLIWALKDPESAGLERVQVIKLWNDENGRAKEKIYDVAWSGERKLVNGKLPLLLDSAQVFSNHYDHNEHGSVQLSCVWEDPDFKPEQAAAYYLRVLEVPNMFAQHRKGQLADNTIDPTGAEALLSVSKKTSGENPSTASSQVLLSRLKERGWSSPIWYEPN